MIVQGLAIFIVSHGIWSRKVRMDQELIHGNTSAILHFIKNNINFKAYLLNLHLRDNEANTAIKKLNLEEGEHGHPPQKQCQSRIQDQWAPRLDLWHRGPTRVNILFKLTYETRIFSNYQIKNFKINILLNYRKFTYDKPIQYKYLKFDEPNANDDNTIIELLHYLFTKTENLILKIDVELFFTWTMVQWCGSPRESVGTLCCNLCQVAYA